MSESTVFDRVADIKQALEETKLLYHVTGDLAILIRDFEFVIAAYEQERNLRLLERSRKVKTASRRR